MFAIGTFLLFVGVSAFVSFGLPTHSTVIDAIEASYNAHKQLMKAEEDRLLEWDQRCFQRTGHVGGRLLVSDLNKYVPLALHQRRSKEELQLLREVEAEIIAVRKLNKSLGDKV